MPGSKYPDEVRAQVVAGARAGLPSPRIAAETNVPARTVREWISHAKEQAQLEEVADLADQGKPTTSLILPVNALRGTAIDKVLKQREQSQPQNLAQLVIVVNAAAPLPEPEIVIEGEI